MLSAVSRKFVVRRSQHRSARHTVTQSRRTLTHAVKVETSINKNNVIDHLQARGLITALTSPDISKAIASSTEPVSFYSGFDPTAPSLHVGHLVLIMTMAHLQRAGLKPIALVGGATGLVGDPSGRSEERPLLSPDNVRANVEELKKQLQRMLGDEIKIVNNYDWYKEMKALEFLRDIGKHFRVNSMLAKDSVKSRLNDHGISYTEFSYQILQAYDFYYLYKNFNCKVQVGGNDQWGNITAGTDLIHKLTHTSDAYGMTVPLLTTSSGVKISKSMGNAVWLSPELDSPYTFYQYFKRLPDEDVPHMMKLLTFLPLEDINQILEEHKKKPELWEAQRILATEVTRFVHGEKGLETAEAATAVLFGGEINPQKLTGDDIIAIFRDAQCITDLPREEVVGKTVINVAHAAKVGESKGELRRLVDARGLYLNNTLVSDKNQVVTANDLIDDKVLLLRSGKRNYKVVRVN